MGFLSSVTGIVSAAIGGKAGSKAAAAQQGAAWDAARQTEERFQISRGELDPWRKAGVNALERYAAFLKPGGMEALAQEVTQTPGYQFQLGEGINALLRAASATGGLGGGATKKRLMEYGQNLASTGAENYLSKLAGLSDVGLGTTRDIAGLREGANALYGDYLKNSAAARSAGYLVRADALSSGLGSFTGGIESGAFGSRLQNFFKRS